MKKHLIILLILLSACSALKKQNTEVSTNRNNNNAILENPETIVSANQNNSYVALKNYNGDTLGYVQHNFIDNKQKYVGKDLNELLNDLEIPIKSFLPDILPLDNDGIPSIALQFYLFNEARRRIDMPNKPVDIIIYWAHPVPLDSVMYILKKNKTVWKEEENKFFGKRIIGDITITPWK